MIIRTCTHTYTHVRVRLYAHTRINIRTYAYTHTHKRVYLYAYLTIILRNRTEYCLITASSAKIRWYSARLSRIIVLLFNKLITKQPNIFKFSLSTFSHFDFSSHVQSYVYHRMSVSYEWQISRASWPLFGYCYNLLNNKYGYTCVSGVSLLFRMKTFRCVSLLWKTKSTKKRWADNRKLTYCTKLIEITLQTRTSHRTRRSAVHLLYLLLLMNQNEKKYVT